MLRLLLLGGLFLCVALAEPNKEILSDLENKGYSFLMLKGRDGRPGRDGRNGTNGERGPQGVAGPPGPRGEQGAPGAAGQRADTSGLQGQISALSAQLAQQKKAFSLLKGAARAGEKVYISNGAQANYNDAASFCSRSGGQLASPMNYAENDAVFSVRNQFGGDAYLGINDIQTEGTFRYLSGQPIGFSIWDSRQPDSWRGNEDCVEMFSNGKWNDQNCGARRLVICEF